MKSEEILKAQQVFKEAISRMTGDDLFLYSRKRDVRRLIDDVWLTVYKKSVSGCENCYMDNLIIISNLTKTFIMEKSKCLYDLKAGALLQDTKCGELIKRIKPEMTEHDLLCTRLNLTNFLAEYHLATNPGCEQLFSILPEDWQQKADKMRKDLYGLPVKAGERVKTPPPPPPTIDAEIDDIKEKELAGREVVIPEKKIVKNTKKRTIKKR